MSFFLPFLFALALPGGLATEDAVTLEKEVAFVGSEIPIEAEKGSKIELTLYFKSPNTLDKKTKIFLHLESEDRKCRAIRDQRAPASKDGILQHTVKIKVPNTQACENVERLHLYTGLYLPGRSGGRFEVTGRPTVDDRIHAGWIDIGKNTEETRVFSPSDIRWGERRDLFWPWRWWVLGFSISALLALLLRRARLLPDLTPLRKEHQKSDENDESHENKGQPPPKSTQLSTKISTLLGKPLGTWSTRFAVAALFVPLMASILAALNFVKDDAYISFRYAHNLIHGDGLVFNIGDKLEGSTTFLWVLVIAPFEALGLDLFQVTEILGSVFSMAMLIAVSAIVIRIRGAQRDLSFLWPGLWLATSSSLALWSTSGMEQALAMWLPCLGAYLLWKAKEKGLDNTALASGIILGLGCMTRPEIHLIAILIGLPLVFETLRKRTLSSLTLKWFAGLLAITAPLHLFRILYYGELFPNTLYVKTGASSLIMLRGLEKLFDMFTFNDLGYLVLLIPMAFADRKNRTAKWVMLSIVAGFMAYVVKVGVDEMRWHRLYLPALPFLAILAGLGLKNLCVSFANLFSKPRWPSILAHTLAWSLVVFAASTNLSFTQDEKGGYNWRGDLSGNFHPDIGKFITRHERPGALVAFQDMGSTPYHAPDINFLDFIGLVDKTVAHARYEHGLNAFAATEAHRNQKKYNAEMRKYFYERSPEWVILTSYVSGRSAKRVSERFGKEPTPKSLSGFVGRNNYQFGIYNQKFKQNYAHVRTWPRSQTYYLSLFRRKDLWIQTPKEVLLDEAPKEKVGVQAQFEGGLELLTSILDSEAKEKHEVYLTTTWKLPGKMAADHFFFIHIQGDDIRVPEDHIPGDWMYPANRWNPGEILEDRVLIQLPPRLKEGEYKVYLGVYRRSTGERLKILKGPTDNQSRLLLGTLKITAQRPLLDHTILPTIIDFHRKHPERIIDHKRKD